MQRMLKIIGKKLNSVFLQLKDVMILNFGDEIEYSLHIASFVRVVRDNEIIFTSSDIFFNSDYEQKSDDDGSLIDITIEDVRKLLIGETVTDLEYNEIGDIKINLTNGFKIEIWTDCLFKNYEYFRFIEYLPFLSESNNYTSKHFIFSYDGSHLYFAEQ